MSATLNITVLDRQGNPVQEADVALLSHKPVITSIEVIPPVLPVGGGTALVRINAYSPIGSHPLTYTATAAPGQGTVQPGANPNEFLWTVP